MIFVTSENTEKKLHLEVFKGSAYKIFGIVTNKSELPLDILHWHRKRCGKSEQEHSRLTKDMAGGRFPSGYKNATVNYFISLSKSLSGQED
jgi:hypothetical protein